MKVYALREKTSGEYSKGGRYALSTTKLPQKLWYSYETFLKFLKYYVNDEKKRIESDIKHLGDAPNWKEECVKWKKWKSTDALKGFELVSFELEDLEDENDTIAQIIKNNVH